MSNIIREYNRLTNTYNQALNQDRECRDELIEMSEENKQILNDFVVEIMTEKSQYRVSVQSHVTITCVLLRIRDVFGIKHTNRTIRFCGLEQLGWKQYPHTD